MQKAPAVIEKVFAEFEKISGRKYNLVEEYKCDDAEVVAVVLGSAFGTMKAAVDELRAKGVKVGLVMPRVFRPWPAEQIAKALDGKKAVIVMDKHLSIGAYGPMYPEVTAALMNCKKIPKAVNYVYGLGGKDVSVKAFQQVFTDVMDGKAKNVNYLGVKE